MGISRYNQSVFGMKISWYSFKTGATYYGGSPLAVDKDGNLVLATYTLLVLDKTEDTAVSYVGAAYNCSEYDASKGTKATFLPATNVLTFCKRTTNSNNLSINVDGSAGQSGDDFPYDNTLSWSAGDLLFIDTNGKWTNVNPSPGKPCFGVVIDTGTNYVTALMYGGPAPVF